MLTNNEQLFLKELATRIKNERISRDISRDALASDVNLSPEKTEEFETKYTNIGIYHFMNIITLLGIELSELMELHKQHMQEEIEERIRNLGDRWKGN